MKIVLGIKTYHSKYYPYVSYYVTINGVQVGTIKFSQQAAEAAIERIRSGADDWDKL